MKKCAFGLCALFIMGSLFAAPKSKSEFCASYRSPKRAQNLLREDTMRMAFANRGGLAYGGVCWWHSRFQRNAAYLTIYRPDLPKPSSREIKRIIKKIRFGRDVVTIPGYSNFYQFSRENEREIQSRLNGWQRHDGFILQSWVIGLAGSSTRDPDELREEMDELYQQVSQGDIVYQKLQIKGIVAHAWLVIGMEKTRDGYELFVIDSNSPYSTQKYTYTLGDESFYHHYYGEFAPYTGQNRELDRIKSAAKEFCD